MEDVSNAGVCFSPCELVDAIGLLDFVDDHRILLYRKFLLELEVDVGVESIFEFENLQTQLGTILPYPEGLQESFGFGTERNVLWSFVLIELFDLGFIECHWVFFAIILNLVFLDPELVLFI